MKRNRDDDKTRYFEEEKNDFDSDFDDDFDDDFEDDYDDDQTRVRNRPYNSYDESDDGEKTVISGRKRKEEIFGFIVVKKGKRKNEKYDITKSDMIIGRSTKCCDIILDDEDVSKIHCRIRKEEDKNEFVFFDCGSANGTLVNGEEVPKITLKSHDIITLGESVEIVFIQV